MKYLPLTLLLLAAVQVTGPENGNLISEPTLEDYQQARRAPGILGAPEEVQDAEGNPASI